MCRDPVRTELTPGSRHREPHGSRCEWPGTCVCTRVCMYDALSLTTLPFENMQYEGALTKFTGKNTQHRKFFGTKINRSFKSIFHERSEVPTC